MVSFIKQQFLWWGCRIMSSASRALSPVALCPHPSHLLAINVIVIFLWTVMWKLQDPAYFYHCAMLSYGESEGEPHFFSKILFFVSLIEKNIFPARFSRHCVATSFFFQIVQHSCEKINWITITYPVANATLVGDFPRKRGEAASCSSFLPPLLRGIQWNGGRNKLLLFSSLILPKSLRDMVSG